MNDALLRRLAFAIALSGASIAAYLTYVHYAHAPAFCTTGGCETVQSSRYAGLFGLPVAALGLACYLLIAWTALIDRPAARAGAAGLALAATLFSAYLLYAQLILIGAVCVWCVANDAVRGDPVRGDPSESLPFTPSADLELRDYRNQISAGQSGDMSIQQVVAEAWRPVFSSRQPRAPSCSSSARADTAGSWVSSSGRSANARTMLRARL